MEDIKIRKSKIEDLQRITELLNQLSPVSEKDPKTNLEMLKQIFSKIIYDDDNYYLAVIEDNNKIIGTGMLLVQINLSHNGRPYAHIENVVVDEKQRGKGIGKKIIEHLIEKAKEKNCYKVILNCKKHYIPFYEKCRMRETGEVEMRGDFE